jgi:hypothetical protein
MLSIKKLVNMLDQLHIILAKALERPCNNIVYIDWERIDRMATWVDGDLVHL